MIELSIIIVNYNAGNLLRECVQSVKQTTDSLKNPSCEIIVVDNASTDESTTGITGIKLTKNTNNQGFARAVNQGIAKAHGEHILLLNPDTKVRDGAIKKILDFAKKTGDAGVVGAQLLEPDASVQPSVFRFPTLWRAFQEFWLGQNVYSKYAPAGSGPSKVDAVVGAAFLISPKARQKVGLLDERYFMYFEDLDYCRRVRNVGLKVYYLPQAQVIHYHGVSGRGLATEREQWRRLIPSSKTYHGVLKHNLINFIIWSGQKWQKLIHRG